MDSKPGAGEFPSPLRQRRCLACPNSAIYIFPIFFRFNTTMSLGINDLLDSSARIEDRQGIYFLENYVTH